MSFDPRFTRWRALFIPQRFGAQHEFPPVAATGWEADGYTIVSWTGETVTYATGWSADGYTIASFVTGEAVTWAFDGYTDAQFSGRVDQVDVDSWNANGGSLVLFYGEAALFLSWDAQGATSAMWGAFGTGWRSNGWMAAVFGGQWFVTGSTSEVRFTGIGSPAPVVPNLWKANGYTTATLWSSLLNGGGPPPVEPPPNASLIWNFAF